MATRGKGNSKTEASWEARARWEALSFTRRKEHVRSLEEAKKPETRSRRLERILSDLDGSTP